MAAWRVSAPSEVRRHKLWWNAMPLIDVKTERKARRMAAVASAFTDALGRRVRAPVFVVSCGRSGTTLFHTLFCSHKDVAGFADEANDLWHPHAYPWIECHLGLPPIWSDPGEFTRGSLASWTRRDRRRIRAVFGASCRLSRGRCFVNTSAMTNFMIPHILDLFPDARFVHLYRDGRAVALSYAKKQRAGMEADPAVYRARGAFLSFDTLLERVAQCWTAHILETERQRKELDLDGRGVLCELSYEDLCRDPEASLRRVASFAGLDGDEFTRKDFADVEDRNHKFREQLDADTIARLTQIEESALRLKSYLT